MSDRVSERMRWLVKFGGQHRDTHIRLSAREVWLKCIQLISSFRQSLKRCGLLDSHWLVSSERAQLFRCHHFSGSVILYETSTMMVSNPISKRTRRVHIPRRVPANMEKCSDEMSTSVSPRRSPSIVQPPRTVVNLSRHTI